MTEEHIDVLGRYRILKVIGSGAMGVVYQAVDPVIDRVVAIKTINLKLSRDDMREYEARFSQEIKAAGKLNHPNIVTIYDVGKTEQFAYMAMEYIEGDELKTLLADEKPLDLLKAIGMAAQVADGLAFAHSRDIIHRDVKPANIMISETEDGMVAKIMDFGIARMPSSSVKTMTGMILGSPRYMSPEQVIGQPIGPHTDVFSLGVVLHEALTGVPPFDGPGINSIMYATVNTPPLAPSEVNHDVPVELDALVARALAKAPANRYQSMRDFARALQDAKRMVESGAWKAVPATERPVAKVVGPAMGAARADASTGSRPLPLSSQFDSRVGTLRLAALTGQRLAAAHLQATPDVGANIAGLVRDEPAATAASATASKPPGSPRKSPERKAVRDSVNAGPATKSPGPLPATPAPTGPPPIYRGDETQFLQFNAAAPVPEGPPPRRRIPVVPAVLLGTLTGVVLILGVALAL